jgi:hypothetical protein
MPPSLSELGGNKSTLGGGGYQRRYESIQPPYATTSLNYLPRDLILDQKEERVELNEHTIIKGKTMYGKKIF